MLGFWLEQPVWLMFLILLAGFMGVVALVHAASFSRRTRVHAARFRGVAPSFFSAPAVLLALLTGFVANDTWERQGRAARVVQSESDNVATIDDLAAAARSDTIAIRRALRTYVEAVVTDEWPAMANGHASVQAANASSLLLRAVADRRIADEAGVSVQAGLIDAVLRLSGDRGARLAINEHRIDDTKWLALFVLGVLTQLAVGIVHLERPRAQLASLLIFSTGLVAALGLIAVHEWPFDGPAAIKPTALEAAGARIAADLGGAP